MRILLLAILILPSVSLAKSRHLPDWKDPKIQADVEYAVLKGHDPYLILAHMAAESGVWIVGGGGKVFGRQTPTHTYVHSASGDYGRHQINCEIWKKMQTMWSEGLRYHDFPAEGRIRKCADLHDDEINRAAYHYMLDLARRRGGGKRRWAGEVGGVPIWMGLYQSGGRDPKVSYLKRIGRHRKNFREWRMANAASGQSHVPRR